MGREFIISPMDRERLDAGDINTAKKYKKLHYSSTPTGSLDVLMMDYFGFVFGYIHIGPTGRVDFQAEIKPRININRKPIPDLIIDIRVQWREIMAFDETYMPSSVKRVGQSSRYDKLPIIELEGD
jgi:hypothetical protein